MPVLKLVDVEKLILDTFKRLSSDIRKRITLVMEQVLQLRGYVKYFPFCSPYTFKTYYLILYYDGINMTFFKVVLE